MNRVLVEIGREVARRSWLGLLSGYLVIVTLLAIGGGEDHTLYFFVVYVFMPLAMAPLAARVLVRDRETGMAMIHSVTPLRRGEILAARVISLFLFLALSLLLSVPISATLLLAGGGGAVLANTKYLAWGFLLGGAATVSGTLIGAVATRFSSAAVSASFGLVVVWVALAESATTLLALAKDERTAEMVAQLLHVSPLVIAYDSLRPLAHPLAPRADAFPPMVVLGSIATGLFALSLVFTKLQDALDWRRPLRYRATHLALASFAASVALFGGALMPTVPAANADMDVAASRAGEFELDYQGFGRGGFEPIRDGDTLTLHLQIRGRPGETHTLDNIAITSPHIDFGHPTSSLPLSLTINEQGFEVFLVDYSVDVLYAGGHIPIDLTATIDGEQLELSGFIIGRPEGANPALILAAGAVVSLFGTLGSIRLGRGLVRL